MWVMLRWWASFAVVIKQKTRFHCGSVGEISTAGAQDVEPRHMLGVLGNRLRPYVRQVPEGTRVFRARMKERGDAWSPCAQALGAPPFDKPRAGRMNRAGSPYLYVAFATKTALRGSEERRVGNACVSPCRYRWQQDLAKTKIYRQGTATEQ